MLEGKKVEIKTNEGFTVLPADKYTVQIVDVNLVNQLKFQSTEEEEVLSYQFQILDDKPIRGADGKETTTRGRFLWKRCRLALNSKSNLGKLAAAVEGKSLTKAEAEKFDPESLVGRQLDVMVNAKPSNKDPEIIWNNVIEFITSVKQLEPLPIEERNVETIQKTTSPAVPVTAPDAEADKFLQEMESGENIDELERKLAEAKAK